MASQSSSSKSGHVHPINDIMRIDVGRVLYDPGLQGMTVNDIPARRKRNDLNNRRRKNVRDRKKRKQSEAKQRAMITIEINEII